MPWWVLDERLEFVKTKLKINDDVIEKIKIMGMRNIKNSRSQKIEPSLRET